MEEQIQETPEQKELREAGERLAAAKKRIADAEQLRLTAARVALAEREAKVQREQHEAAERVRQNEEKWARVKAEKESKEAAERATENAKQRQLESEFAAREEEARQRAAHEESVKKIQEQAFQMEQEARRLEQEALSAQNVTVSEVAPTAPSTEPANGRDLLFSRLVKPASGADGLDRHHVEVPAPVDYPSKVQSNSVEDRLIAQFGVQAVDDALGFIQLEGSAPDWSAVEQMLQSAQEEAQ